MNYPSIILSRPQLGKNIGAVARVMKNFQFNDLRIINPRDGWPNIDAITTSAGAEDLLKNAKIFSSLEYAVKDINFLISTSARKRDLNLKQISISEAIKISIDTSDINVSTGFLFGCENSGLSNIELIKSDYILSIPVNKNFSSLNLSHAVMIICWEF